MTNENDPLRKRVNRTGFPLQLAVERAITTSTDQHRWEIAAREYPWRHRDDLGEGFCDLIATRGNEHLVIECKRTKGRWIFLVEPDRPSTGLVRADVLTTKGSDVEAVRDLYVKPGSFESEFCIPVGEDGNVARLLEPMAREAVRATQAIRWQFARWLNEVDQDQKGVFLPVIVTTADLVTCHVDPSKISLEEGEMPADVSFEEASLVRFRKSVDTTLPGADVDLGDYGASKRIRERTILIVKATHIVPVLSAMERFTTRHGAMFELTL